jgi:hypothetical protein
MEKKEFEVEEKKSSPSPSSPASTTSSSSSSPSLFSKLFGGKKASPPSNQAFDQKLEMKQTLRDLDRRKRDIQRRIAQEKQNASKFAQQNDRNGKL